MRTNKVISVVLLVMTTNILYSMDNNDELFDAIKHCDVWQVQQILQTTPKKISQKNELGYTPLHYAVLNGDYENIDGKPEMVWIPFNKRTDVVRQLIEKANVNVKNYGRTPLHMMLYGPRWNDEQAFALTALFIKKGAFVNARDVLGKTPLDLAYTRKNTPGRKNIIDLLECHGAKRGDDIRSQPKLLLKYFQ